MDAGSASRAGPTNLVLLDWFRGFEIVLGLACRQSGLDSCSGYHL